MSDYLYVVILALNPGTHLKRLLAAVSTLKVVTRAIVIDQGSTDGTREWLRTVQGDGLILVTNEANIGVAAGWNQGIRIAMANRAQAVLVCGHDTWPMPGAIERLVKHAEAGVPFITGTAVAYDTPDTPIAPLAPTDPLLAAPDFSCFLLPVKTLVALGMHEAQQPGEVNPWGLGFFDEEFYPAFFEDNSYHYRLYRAGFFAARDPLALFRHDCSLTLRSTPAVAEQNVTSFRENAERFRKKWGGLPHELDMPAQARPGNVTDEQWQAMTGGREVQQLDPVACAEQAKSVYAQYGVAA